MSYQDRDVPQARLSNPFDCADGYPGRTYPDRDAELARPDPSGGAPSTLADDGDPPEAGKRASVDPATGEVHGAGAGVGGGNAGEDHDSDEHGGSGYPRMGAAGDAAVSEALDD